MLRAVCPVLGIHLHRFNGMYINLYEQLIVVVQANVNVFDNTFPGAA
jgi:hypothetical protein